MNVPITALYTGLLAILIVSLGMNVVRTRWKEQVPLGDGGKKAMEKAIRIHGNAIENIPIALLLLLSLEINGATHMLLHVCGSLFLGARILHVFGLSRTIGVSAGRFSGTLLSWGVISFMAVINILHFL